MAAPDYKISAGARAGIGIGLLFRLLKASAEHGAIRELGPTDDERYEMALTERDLEVNSQRDKLDRMRAQSRAGMQMALAGRGINPMLTGRSGSVDPYYIAAAARRSPVGRVM